MFYRECEGCYSMIRYNDIIFVKSYMDGNNLMSSQWLCEKCYGIFLESYIEYRRND